MVYVCGNKLFSYKVERAITKRPIKKQHHLIWIDKKNWKLKFDDNKQWKLFNKLHKECYKKNIEAIIYPKITIPGVKVIEDILPNDSFIQPCSMYIHTIENEVEKAFKTIVYNMGSEDEEWLSQINKPT